MFGIRKITWEKCRKKVISVNPKLGTIIDLISPGSDMPLWLVSYPYGATIDDGTFYYPKEDGQLVTIDDSNLPRQMREDLKYAGTETPAGLVLKNTIELFIEAPGRIIPMVHFMPGNLMALWGRLDSKNIYHPSPIMRKTAGARSIFMVPNISDLNSHRKLRNDFNIKMLPAKNLSEQWTIFTAITNQSKRNIEWQTEVLFFTTRWLDLIKSDQCFRALYIYLLEYAWKNTAYWRNKVFYDYFFSCVQEKRNLKPNPYLMDTVKYLMTIALGAAPGFGVAKNNIAAPVDYIQEVYIHCYGLKKYAPTIMHPIHFDLNLSEQPAYYSLQYPTTLEFSPRSRQIKNTLYDMIELKHILDVFFDEILLRKLKIEHGVIGKIAEAINFDFFHSSHDRYGEISLSKNMLDGDPGLVHTLAKGASDRFADNGAFVRGCIRVSKGK